MSSNDQADKLKQVTKELDIIISNNDEPKSVDDFLGKVEKLRAVYSTSAFNELQISVATKKEVSALILSGSRDETKDEKEERERAEALERQKIEQAELKEYLRLHKKYGKKKK